MWDLFLVKTGNFNPPQQDNDNKNFVKHRTPKDSLESQFSNHALHFSYLRIFSNFHFSEPISPDIISRATLLMDKRKAGLNKPKSDPDINRLEPIPNRTDGHFRPDFYSTSLSYRTLPGRRIAAGSKIHAQLRYAAS